MAVMPLYSFRCDLCGHADLEYGSMRSAVPSGDAIMCPVCLRGQTYVRQVDRPNTPLTEFSQPIEMHSVACNSWEEIREIQRKCPDVQISDDPNHPDFGVPIARNRQQKLQVLKAVGFVESN